MLDYNDVKSLMSVIKEYYDERKTGSTRSLRKEYYDDKYSGVKAGRSASNTGVPAVRGQSLGSCGSWRSSDVSLTVICSAQQTA